METWEQIALGAIILVFVLWRFPTMMRQMKQDNDAPKDWKGVLIPIGLVVVFVLLLINLA
jgi:uncharacterized membrane protein YidH (DUF202 family)